MSTRRKFLFNGGLAATAFLTAKPFNSVASSLGSLTGLKLNNNSLTLVHTGNALTSGTGHTQQHIEELKNSKQNLILLHAGEKKPAIQPLYDASLHAGESFSVAASDYRIIYKGNIKTGVITATNPGVSADSINELAAYLKNSRNCHLVVCLSQLGFKSSAGLNDLELAAASTHIDVIIGGHVTDACTRPVVAQNRNKQEVIINHAAGNGLAMRTIDIAFNSLGKKEQVQFGRSC